MALRHLRKIRLLRELHIRRWNIPMAQILEVEEQRELLTTLIQLFGV